MKNLSNILNIVLLVAVAILYYLHFKDKPESAQVVPAAALKSLNMVYVNNDSLLSEYDFFKSKKAELEDKQEKIKESLKAESTKLQNEAAEYQKKAATMTDQQRQQVEEQLGMKQQQLMQRKDELLGKLDDDQAKTNEELYTRLTSFIREYNKKKNYSFILGRQKGGGILFANDSLDITKEVVEGLNKAYREEQKK